MERHIRERASVLFGALAHPTRLRIVELLLQGERTVTDIAGTLELQQSSTSQHLAILARAGVLVAEPRGAARYYRVRGPRIAQCLAVIEEFCQTHQLYGYDHLDEPDDGNVLSDHSGCTLPESAATATGNRRTP